MDPTSIVEDTEQTRLCPQTDRQADRQTDMVKPVYPPFNFVEAGGIIIKIPLFLDDINSLPTKMVFILKNDFWYILYMSGPS